MLRRQPCAAPLSFTTVPAGRRLLIYLMALGIVVLFATSGFAQTPAFGDDVGVLTGSSVAGGFSVFF